MRPPLDALGELGILLKELQQRRHERMGIGLGVDQPGA